ncbi:MAG TPA: hypothetical protein VFJ24_04835 [Gaiellales bacterium]|nr:hypothetical protein [Gaiellales bacterium]
MTVAEAEDGADVPGIAGAAAANGILKSTEGGAVLNAPGGVKPTAMPPCGATAIGGVPRSINDITAILNPLSYATRNTRKRSGMAPASGLPARPKSRSTTPTSTITTMLARYDDHPPV